MLLKACNCTHPSPAPTPSFVIGCFHIRIVWGIQFDWVVMSRKSTDKEGKKHEEEENPAHQLARTENRNPSPSAGFFTTKTNFGSLGVSVFTLALTSISSRRGSELSSFLSLLCWVVCLHFPLTSEPRPTCSGGPDFG